jgi:hypothetical protein
MTCRADRSMAAVHGRMYIPIAHLEHDLGALAATRGNIANVAAMQAAVNPLRAILDRVPPDRTTKKYATR